jgi:WD40 repeat protein
MGRHLTPTLWLLIRQRMTFVQFDLQTMLVAVCVWAAIFGFLRTVKNGLERSWRQCEPPVGRKYTLAISDDGKVTAASADYGFMFLWESAEEDGLKHMVDLARHPINGQFYAMSWPPRYHRWNSRSVRWEQSDEGFLLQFTRLAQGSFVLILIAFVIALLPYNVLRKSKWTRGSAIALGSATVAFGALHFVPTAWEVSQITRAAFSPDGSKLATVSDDGSNSIICLWSVSTGEPLAKMDVRNVCVDSVVFSPDGVQLTAVREGRTAFVWDLKPFHQIE